MTPTLSFYCIKELMYQWHEYNLVVFLNLVQVFLELLSFILKSLLRSFVCSVIGRKYIFGSKGRAKKGREKRPGK